MVFEVRFWRVEDAEEAADEAVALRSSIVIDVVAEVGLCFIVSNGIAGAAV